MSEKVHSENTPEGSRMGMWLFLLSEIILFFGLFILYAVYLRNYSSEFVRAGAQLNQLFGTINTLVLLTSSLFAALSVTALQKKKKGTACLLLSGTIFLAVIFLCIKYFEWIEKIDHGIYPGSASIMKMSKGSATFYALYYAMTGLHGIHVIIGILALTICLVLIIKNRITPESNIVLENCALYWHLVDIIWIFLFPLFYLIV